MTRGLVRTERALTAGAVVITSRVDRGHLAAVLAARDVHADWRTDCASAERPAR